MFWHDFFSSTVSADRTLSSTYGYNRAGAFRQYELYCGVHDLRGRNDGSSPIVEIVDGVIDIDIFKSNGIYDGEMRGLYFRMVREHPWRVLRSF